MLLPDKHVRLSESVLGLGAFVLSLLDRPRTADQLYQKVKEACEDRTLPAYHDFDSVTLTVLFLYTIGVVEATESGAIYRCAS